MTRKELYSKVKELNAADAIKDTFGDNFTRVSSANLEDFLKGFKKKPTSVKKKSEKSKSSGKSNHTTSMKEVKGTGSAIVKLLSILQVKKVLTAQEAEEVAEVL